MVATLFLEPVLVSKQFLNHPVTANNILLQTIFFQIAIEYGPAYLLTEDVIMVTFNYRVGVLG